MCIIGWVYPRHRAIKILAGERKYHSKEEAMAQIEIFRRLYTFNPYLIMEA